LNKQINILNKLKTSVITSLLLVCFASFTFSSDAYATTNPSPTFAEIKDSLLGNDTSNIKPAPEGESSLFRTQANELFGSAAIDREVRMVNRALTSSMEKGNADPMLKYSAAIIGDSLVLGFDTIDDIASGGIDLIDNVVGGGVDIIDNAVNSGFDAYENMMPEGLIKDILVNYNIGYQMSKWAITSTLGIVKGTVNLVVGTAKGTVGLVTGIGKWASRAVFGISNRRCNIERMNSIYKSSCYSCVVVKSLISSFMNACSRLYDISREAGSKILALGTMLWIAFYVFTQISSFKSIEPASMVNDMLMMAFKIIGAYVVINAGISFFIDYFIVPFMTFGTDFGIMMIISTTAATGLNILDSETATSYLMTSAEVGDILPVALLNSIITYVAAVDAVVSTHMQIGHMLTCHATHAGAWRFVFVISNFWILICGAAIWFCGFMMTLAVAYYLIDISFKLGFSIIALPIVIGLWPFNITKDKVASVFQIILKSAGIFIFLAMTTGIGLALIDQALNAGNDMGKTEVSENVDANAEATPKESGAQKLFTAIEDGNTEYVSEKFALFGPSFMLIIFAYLYAFKLIGSTVGDYVDKFFPDGVFGGNNPMHKMMTQATDMVKKTAMRPVKAAGRIAKHQAGRGLKAASNKYTPKIKQGLNKLISGKTGDDKDKDKSKSGGGGGSGTAMKNAGKATKNVGKGMEKTGEGVKKGGDALDKAGQNLSKTKFGAIIGVPLSAAGKATKAGGEALKQAGKVTKEAGKQMEQAGKQMEKNDKADSGNKDKKPKQPPVVEAPPRQPVGNVPPIQPKAEDATPKQPVGNVPPTQSEGDSPPKQPVPKK